MVDSPPALLIGLSIIDTKAFGYDIDGPTSFIILDPIGVHSKTMFLEDWRLKMGAAESSIVVFTFSCKMPVLIIVEEAGMIFIRLYNSRILRFATSI